MRNGLNCGRSVGLWAGLLAAGLSLTLLSCHVKTQTSSAATAVPDESVTLADKGAAEIATVCTRQSYATAKQGLIAGETGLQEDVFEMRDPTTYQIIPYRLGAAVRLQTQLRKAAASGRPEEQMQCMRDFADHLKEICDPLLEAVKTQKGVDALAFQDAEKQAQQEIEMDKGAEKSH